MRFSWTLVFSGVFIAYILHSIYSIVSIYIPPKCGTSHCLKSVLASQPELHLVVGTTHRTTLKSWRELTQVASFPFPYTQPSFSRNLTIPIPRATRQNGTLHMYAFAIPAPIREAADPLSFVNGPNTLMAYFKLTQYLVPEAETFNLLNSKEKKVEKEEDGGDKKSSADGKQKKNEKPVSHLAKVVRLTMLSEPLVLPAKDLPPDFGMLIRLVTSDTYLPPLRFDKFNSRIRDFYKVNATEEQVTVEFQYSSASIGSMRMAAQFQAAMETMEAIGFTSKDLDEIKGVFSDTNVYLLALTMFIASIHLLFDFLAFKNDVVYWQKRKSTAGLSSRTILWRCFSQIVVFLYLMEEKSSMLIIIPSGIGALIEIWKVTKALKIKVYMEGRIPRIKYGEYNASEEATEKHDVESMRYLSYILYPLCICGAIYSLLYTPHKSWYSWTVQSMVNGVYAFGFLFMLPQLFINYRLKSVAHLPWRAFMYKAFNTFIDDIFAFIITMPTAHRVACFRDDIVFLIYLYQRWLYPVDKSRVDAGGDVEYEADADEGKPLQRSDKSSTASASDKKND